MNREWYIFYCQYNHEKKIHVDLLKYGYESYLPLICKEKQWSDRKRKIDFPMFPSYLFVHCEGHQVYQILQFKGVVATVKDGKEHARLRESEVAIIRKIEANPDKIEVISLSGKTGDKVKIMSGCFSGQTGEILQFEDGKKMILLLELLSSKVVVTLESVQATILQ